MRILCFGDSNTWGYVPGTFKLSTGKFERYNDEKRWTSLLALSDKNYQVIEDGLCGRTTDIDDPTWPDRNGLTHLARTLETQTPIDILVIMLGTNDLKHRFSRTANDVALGIEKLILKAKEIDSINHLIKNCFLVIPPVISEDDLFDGEFKDAVEKSKALKNEFTQLAQKHDLHLIDASNIDPSPLDGIHLDDNGHRLLADKVVFSVKQLANKQNASKGGMSMDPDLPCGSEV